MDPTRCFERSLSAKLNVLIISNQPVESEMNITTVAVDLAKDVFEVAEADGTGRILKRSRLSRPAFIRFLAEHPVCHWILEACGGAHHWARRLQSLGHEVRLLPAQYVRPYRRRNKTDRADCAALIEAAKNHEIRPVPVKGVAAQAIQGLHRIRSQWMSTRTNRINVIRGCLREFGIVLPVGAIVALKRIPEALDDEAIPGLIRESLRQLLAEIRDTEIRIVALERQLAQLAAENDDIERLRQVSGIGLLTATALYASVGDAGNFQSGRHLAAWIGLTPKEHSSGNRRHLGAISKRGDIYVRMLLTHGARSVLGRAIQMAKANLPLNRLQRWALQLQARAGYNKAAIALANKLTRIAWATWRYRRDFNPDHAAMAGV